MESGGRLLQGIKSKLGFADRRQDDGYGDYDDYDDYGEDGYADYAEYEDYDDATASERYGSSRAYGAPSASGRRAQASSDAAYQTGSFTSTSIRDRARRDNSEEGPRLVSLGDVRATTPYPSIQSNDEQTSEAGVRSATPSPTSRSRAVLDSSLPFSMTREGTEAASAHANTVYNASQQNAANQQGRGGLNALFGGSSSASATTGGRRSLFVIAPKSYNEVEPMATALNRGQIVVLDIREADSELSRRLLDFSFGVASALFASVDCVASGVFCVCTGHPINDEERTSLSARGLI